MTLAVILSVCAFFCTPVFALGMVPKWARAAGQESSPTKPPDTATDPTQKISSPQTAQPATPAPSDQSKAAPVKPTPHKTGKKKTKKKTATANCTPAAAAESDSPGSPAPAANTATANAPPTKCPPPITVVHDGGTSDPAIKLTGGTAPAQPSEKHAADQLVGTTEENLKKIQGRELSASQQEMLTQIHQFLEQSKAATAAGDIDRGHNLAMKAHLLSDELTKP